jgi:hypothetical protein
MKVDLMQTHPPTRFSRLRCYALMLCLGPAAALAASDNSNRPQRGICSQQTIERGLRSDPLATVLLVKEFKKDDFLILSGTPGTNTPRAANDLCFAKINVGPGNPGPTGAPSTSPGIGIEIWLPTPSNWNKRIHNKGGGGWAGGPQGTLTSLATSSGSGGNAPEVAGIEGAVSATTDTGHSGGNGAFAMNPDGSINTVLWHDFAARALHEQAEKSKNITREFYGEAARFVYFNGFSTGGRQGLKLAQVYPGDYDGILAGAPVVNWSRFITTELYPQIVMQRDLGGVVITAAQHATVGAAAVAACDVVGGVHLGYVLDPTQCRYDPTQDKSVLCTSVGGNNATAGCVNIIQAQAFNKFWFGQTPDGSVPSPALDNGMGVYPTIQRWFGVTRGSRTQSLAGSSPFGVASDMVALELQNPTIAQPSFVNATGNGADGWKALTYAQLNTAFDFGLLLQPQFSYINTEEADLHIFRNRGGKILSYHGLADQLVPPQGTVNYYNRVAAEMGGFDPLQSFYRLYFVPGMAHGFSNGSAVQSATPPLPSNEDLYRLLTAWVENGVQPPSRVDLSTAPTAPLPASRPICLYPLKPTYLGGSPLAAVSYACQ